MKKIAFIVFLSFAFPGACFPTDEEYQLERIVVTGSRLPANSLSQTRSVSIITSDHIKDSPYQALPDILSGLGGIDMRRRNQEGVQADISIRGTTFEQNQVLINGIKMGDPQTGHHTCDLPITRFDIGAIDILKGHGSSLYGPNAFGGVVNFITLRPQGDAIEIDSSGGTYDFCQAGLSVSNSFGAVCNRFSFDSSRSSGYRAETEFRTLTITETVSSELAGNRYDLLFGYSTKDFGADSFYSELYQNEEEHTDTRLFTVSGMIEEKGLNVVPKLFLKRLRDKFVLDRNRPGWATNYHTTYLYGGELGFVFESDAASVAYGVELAQETVDSTNLQEHHRTRSGFYIEASPRIGDTIILQTGVRADRYSGFDWEYTPSISASYELIPQCRVRSSIGRAFRVPTFTDLYYNDPANQGNAALRPESSWSYEVGVDAFLRGVTFQATAFRREGRDIIDWVKFVSASPWQAQNIGSVDTNGVELSCDIDVASGGGVCKRVRRLVVGTALLDSDYQQGYLSKYSLDYLKAHVFSNIEVALPCDLKNIWTISFKKRKGDSGYLVIDTRISRVIVRKERLLLEGFIEATNLGDSEYSEIGSVPMPGRWIKSGLRCVF